MKITMQITLGSKEPNFFIRKCSYTYGSEKQTFMDLFRGCINEILVNFLDEDETRVFLTLKAEVSADKNSAFEDEDTVNFKENNIELKDAFELVSEAQQYLNALCINDEDLGYAITKILIFE